MHQRFLQWHQKSSAVYNKEKKKEEERANVKWCNLFTIALKFYLNCLIIIHTLEEWSKT